MYAHPKRKLTEARAFKSIRYPSSVVKSSKTAWYLFAFEADTPGSVPLFPSSELASLCKLLSRESLASSSSSAASSSSASRWNNFLPVESLDVLGLCGSGLGNAGLDKADLYDEPAEVGPRKPSFEFEYCSGASDCDAMVPRRNGLDALLWRGFGTRERLGESTLSLSLFDAPSAPTAKAPGIR